MRLARIRRETGDTGLIYATSPDIGGLLVAKPDADALNARIPTAIHELFAVKGRDVSVRLDANGDAIIE